MTIWPAYASIMEDVSGSLTPRMYAEFVVLDQDIMTVSTDPILDTLVLKTVLGGTAGYRSAAQH